jgi:serine/threonine protein phosphatase 1
MPFHSPDPAMARLTFAIGDVHGCIDKLDELMRHCKDFASGRAIRFVMLGDYVDRGPDSNAVVSRLMASSAICLKGNHEDLLVKAHDRGGRAELEWMVNGAEATLESYRARKVQDIPRSHLDWMRALTLFHDDGQRFFVHAGIDFSVPLDQQDPHTMLWTRSGIEDRDPGRLIVHGHTPQHSGLPFRTPYRLNLDTAAVMGGPLTAAAFDDTQTLPIAFLNDKGRVFSPSPA